MDLPRQQLFTNKALLRLILPLLLESALGILVGVVDSIMVSSVGEAAISGVSLVTNISGILLNFSGALAAGGAVVTSQFLGAGKKEDSRRSAGQLITMTTGVSLLITAVCLVFSRQLLRLFFGNIEQAVMDAAVTYFFYNAISFPFLALCSAGTAIFRSRGNSKMSLYISLLRNAVNIAGNAICIYGLKMGVEGVAIPTALSRAVGAAVIMGAVFSPKEDIRPALQDVFSLNPGLMKRIARVGLPSAFGNCFHQFGRVLMLSMIADFGTSQITANATANSITGFVIICTTSFSTAAITVIGQCVGAGDAQQLKLNFKKLMLSSYLLFGFASVLVYLLRYPIIGLYDSLSPETVELTAQLLFIYLIFGVVLHPLAFAMPGCLQATNNSAYTMWVNSVAMLGFRMAAAWLLCIYLDLGAVGVWIAMGIDWTVRAICFSWFWFTGRWKKKCGMA